MENVNPELPLTVTLTAAQWNSVLALVAEGPWRLSDPLIKSITRQVFEGAGAAQRQAPALNGAEEPASVSH